MMVTPTDWRSIESQFEQMLISRRLEYNLPVKLDGVKPESQQILLEYLNEHKWELEYQQAITYDDSSCLAFFHYATKQMREKLQIYDELEELQERSGGVSAVILIALGTLIWLIHSFGSNGSSKKSYYLFVKEINYFLWRCVSFESLVIHNCFGHVKSIRR
jgi:hypothetical protein